MGERQQFYETRRVIKYRQGEIVQLDDNIVNEIPLTLMLNGEEFATLVCSPVMEKELVIGFLAGEGIISDPDDIKDYFYREKQRVVWIETFNAVPQMDTFLGRNFASCCGKGRPSLYFLNDQDNVRPVIGDLTIPAETLLELMRRFDAESDIFKTTGGVHSAALADKDRIIARYDDIGRHNALDRIMGYKFLNRLDTGGTVVLLSGRISSEMLIKTARIGSPVVISRSAPTGLAVDYAIQYGITVAGFARGAGFNIYCNEERISGL